MTKLGIAPVQLEEGTHKLTITAPQGNLGLKQLEPRPVVVDVVKTQGTTYLEAENSQDMRNTTKYENFMGYGEWGYTEHIIDVSQDGKYNARIQYAIGDMGERQASPLTLSLDHKTVKEDELKFTGDWMQFSTVTLGEVNLQKGIHTLKLSADQGGINVDHLSLELIIDDKNSGGGDSGNNGGIGSNSTIIQQNITQKIQLEQGHRINRVAVNNIEGMTDRKSVV